jgi:anti-sigma factor RsiW
MKICWLVRRALGVYQDGALGHRRAQWVVRHLQNCPACQRELLEWQQVTHLLRSLPGPSRSPDYWVSALRQLRGKRQHLPRYPTRSSWLEYLKGSPANPAQALMPVSLLSMALLATVTFLGLEEEAFAFFTSYFLPIALQ